MRLVAAPLGLLLALVIAVLAVPQVVDMESTLRPLTSGGVQSLIDSFDLLMLLVVALVGIGLMEKEAPEPEMKGCCPYDDCPMPNYEEWEYRYMGFPDAGQWELERNPKTGTYRLVPVGQADG